MSPEGNGGPGGRTARLSEDQESRRELIASIASMYYLDNLDQNAIGKQVGLSRSTVSRMITEARQSGIVSIRIVRALPRDRALEDRARAEYGLRDALVVAAPSPGVAAAPLARVGMLAARHLEQRLPKDGTLAISWGTSVSAVADGLTDDPSRQVRTVQMLGAAGSRQPAIDGPELARTFAARLGGEYRTLNAPLVLDDEALVLALLRQHSVSSVLAAAAQADVAVIGLGCMAPEGSSLLRAGFAQRADLADSVAGGAVGDAGGHMLAADGSVVQTALSRRMLRLDEQSLRDIPEVVAVAVGPAKVAIIRAALRSGIVDVIATDAPTMEAVLSHGTAGSLASHDGKQGKK